MPRPRRGPPWSHPPVFLGRLEPVPSRWARPSAVVLQPSCVFDGPHDASGGQPPGAPSSQPPPPTGCACNPWLSGGGAVGHCAGAVGSSE
eukprot:CAMPEP_0204238858 /NCGR_PEP_ID=MMETSP0361-20130328/94083_1 /ASSEMBLY_ACC=CAM_ASM_000343 /TAXON_ID=268821 /ORGANISM="Scrippsiella Hangoei, Strain SHTV-5" /LENGTH=89 /DNA_ID=CAMNT_0051211639 /DNA_START=193 /DNA_END=459 /DNA_ORIENTATION=+